MEREKGLCVVCRGPRSKTKHSAHFHSFDLSLLEKLVCWLIDNVFIVNDSTCRRQEIGIPMGTNSAPPLCNLYLYFYESKFIDSLIEQGKEKEAADCHLSFRLIDDILTIDHPLPDLFFKCYPSFLKLNDTSLPNNEVNFLGMHFSSSGGKLFMKVYDKRKDFPFKVVRYPNLMSAIPASIIYGVFTGLLHRFYLISSTVDDFLEVSTELAATLGFQGASEKKLLKGFCSFLKNKHRKWHMKLHVLISRFKKAFKDKFNRL